MIKYSTQTILEKHGLHSHDEILQDHSERTYIQYMNRGCVMLNHPMN